VTDAPTPFRDLTIAEFVERLASSAPVPGGGSASAITGALGAALVRMVVALSLDKPKYAAYDNTLRQADEIAARSLDRLLALADEDAAAYAALSAAFKMPKTTAKEGATRRSAIHDAARQAALAPLQVLHECFDVLVETEAIAGRSNLNARSDAATAASLAEAGLRGAAANVLINLASTGDDAFAEETTADVVDLLEQADDVATRARFAVAQSELRDPEEE
jgi:formiminotetrahydrofolate cyclodeaminase